MKIKSKYMHEYHNYTYVCLDNLYMIKYDYNTGMIGFNTFNLCMKSIEAANNAWILSLKDDTIDNYIFHVKQSHTSAKYSCESSELKQLRRPFGYDLSVGELIDMLFSLLEELENEELVYVNDIITMWEIIIEGFSSLTKICRVISYTI